MHTGDQIELQAGPAVHGGHCLSRYQGRVVFLRHAIPGERVVARLTDVAHRSHWRADAVEILQASPDRVRTPWPEAGPGGVGGGELGHLSLTGQRAWKHAVIDDALERIGHLDAAHPARRALQVLPAPHEAQTAGLGYRTRVRFIADAAGRAGMYRYRSHEVLPLTQMPLARAELDVPGLLARQWRPGAHIDAVAPNNADPVVLLDGEPLGSPRRVVRERVEVAGVGSWQYRLDAASFWQVHHRAPSVLVSEVVRAAAIMAGDRVLDLYSGSGLFSLPLADATGPTGSVRAIEGDPTAGRHARRNAHDRRTIRLERDDVGRALRRVEAADVVVLDPPRTGAGRAVVQAVARLQPRRIVYVACDPAALARDVALARRAGYDLTRVTGHDLFCHTHHVEAVAVLEPGASVA